MKNAMGIGLLIFCLVYMIQNINKGVGEESSWETDEAAPLCECYEYYFNNLPVAMRTLYQSCDEAILDYRGDKTLEVSTFSIPCDSTFNGVRMIPRSRD